MVYLVTPVIVLFHCESSSFHRSSQVGHSVIGALIFSLKPGCTSILPDSREADLLLRCEFIRVHWFALSLALYSLRRGHVGHV